MVVGDGSVSAHYRAIFVTKTKTRTITDEKTKTKNLGANDHTAILCQPAAAQQCEHNLASIVLGLKNRGIIWWFNCWISTSLKSSTRLLIRLRQMPPHSGNSSRLFTACWLLLRSCGGFCITGLRGAFFRCFSVYSGRRSSMQQSLEN